MINIKRLFLDFLYTHPSPYKKTIKVKTKGYSLILSASQLLKEIENETEVGNQMLEKIDYLQKTFLNLYNGINDESFMLDEIGCINKILESEDEDLVS